MFPAAARLAQLMKVLRFVRIVFLPKGSDELRRPFLVHDFVLRRCDDEVSGYTYLLRGAEAADCTENLGTHIARHLAVHEDGSEHVDHLAGAGGGKLA